MSITAAEERILARAAKLGDKQALADLLQAHAGLLYQLARKSGLKDIDDAYQEICISAIESLARYDPERGTRFSSYMGKKAGWTLSRLRKKAGVVRVPANVFRVGVYGKEAACALKVVSIDARDNETDLTLAETLVAKPTEMRDLDFEAKINLLFTAISILPDKRMRYIVTQRMAGDTLQSIADNIGLSQERVRQLLRQAVRSIRRRLGVD